MIKRWRLAFLLLVLSGFLNPCFSQPPSGYYDPAIGLSGKPLQQALHNIIRNHTVSSYTPGVWQAFYTTDCKPNNTVWDIYSDIPDGSPNGNPPYIYHFGTDQCGTATQEGDCYSREHSWPKSWFGGAVLPMYTDLFIIYPTDQYVNGRRSDYPYGEVGVATWTSLNGSQLGNCVTTGYSEKVFEPRDEYKGDLARSYFYVSVRYYTEDSGWPGSPMATGSQLNPWALAMLKQWNQDDPVSSKEIDRNNAIFLIQNNRNPFIDHPEFVSGIWGGGTGILPTASFSRELFICPNPTGAYCSIALPFEFTNQEPVVETYLPTGKKIDVPCGFDGSSVTLDMKNCPAGLYFFTLKGPQAKTVFHGKIIRE